MSQYLLGSQGCIGGEVAGVGNNSGAEKPIQEINSRMQCVRTNPHTLAMKIPGIVIVHIKSSMLCFSNANSITERVNKWITEEEVEGNKEDIRNIIK
ncbi:hypothetical protein Lal_00038161 [Lupinus albus]|nr:hypothetical protein Lal_00038161 [Lupinus albus]